MVTLFRIAPGDFYLAEEDARITFVRDDKENVEYFLFLQDGKTCRAVRVNWGGRDINRDFNP